MVLTPDGGFEPPRTVLHLAFESPDLAGLDVRMYVPPLGEFMRLLGLAGDLAPALSTGQATAEQGQQALAVYDILATYLKSWNVTSGGVPVPTTREGMATLEISFLNRIMQAWQAAIGEVPDPLAPSSPSTPLPDLPHIPMGSVPESLAS